MYCFKTLYLHVFERVEQNGRGIHFWTISFLTGHSVVLALCEANPIENFNNSNNALLFLEDG